MKLESRRDRKREATRAQIIAAAELRRDIVGEGGQRLQICLEGMKK